MKRNFVLDGRRHQWIAQGIHLQEGGQSLTRCLHRFGISRPHHPCRPARKCVRHHGIGILRHTQTRAARGIGCGFGAGQERRSDLHARGTQSKGRSDRGRAADQTAYLMAEFTNVTNEILLPRTASHLRGGALVGQIDFASLARGDTAEPGFDAIEGLRLTRDMPLRTEGIAGSFPPRTKSRNPRF